MQNLQQILNQGLQALHNNELMAAEQKFNVVLTAVPGEPNALFLLGNIRQRQGLFEEAVAFSNEH